MTSRPLFSPALSVTLTQAGNAFVGVCPITVSVFCWDDWYSISVTSLISLSNDKIRVLIFCRMGRMKISKSSCVVSFCLTVSSLIHLFPLTFYCKHVGGKKIPFQHVAYFSQISNFKSLNFYFLQNSGAQFCHFIRKIPFSPVPTNMFLISETSPALMFLFLVTVYSWLSRFLYLAPQNSSNIYPTPKLFLNSWVFVTAVSHFLVP